MQIVIAFARRHLCQNKGSMIHIQSQRFQIRNQQAPKIKVQCVLLILYVPDFWRYLLIRDISVIVTDKWDHYDPWIRVDVDVDPPAIAAALVGAPVAVGMASRPPSGKTEIVAAFQLGEWPTTASAVVDSELPTELGLTSRRTRNIYRRRLYSTKQWRYSC
jgi:hypothetical protein